MQIETMRQPAQTNGMLMTRAAPLQLQTRAAELVPASFEPSDNSVDVIFTTGATVRRNSWNE
ncbi:MAG: hypothetical protein FJX06_19860, partial [Alphaproteobacteria bacterium]|nr:hypothetical protein [Alphaproteobacteria bacterium]